MKTLRSFLQAFLALLALLSCSRGTYGSDTFPGNEDRTGQVALRISTDTKSVLPQALETAVNTLLVVICRDDDPSQWKSLYQQGDQPMVATLQLHKDYTVYAFVNMGNVLTDIPRADGGALDFPAFRYTIDSYGQLLEKGLPMAGRMALQQDKVAGDAQLTLTVDRLMAKVQVNVDGVRMEDGCVYMRNVANTLYPFAEPELRRARSRAEIFEGDTDWEAFQSAESLNGRNQTLVFYVPENCQGKRLSTQMQWMKSADFMDDEAASLCTYLEFQAQKGGTADGISGPVTYRCYLGGNTTDDFSVERNADYLAQLSLGWDGLFSGQTWRIDASGIDDARRLCLSEQPGTQNGVAPDLGKVKRKKTFSLYVNFSRDGGSQWVGNAKDVNTWPFGWNLYIDDIRQAGGASGTADGDIGWAYFPSLSVNTWAVFPFSNRNIPCKWSRPTGSWLRVACASALSSLSPAAGASMCFHALWPSAGCCNASTRTRMRRLRKGCFTVLIPARSALKTMGTGRPTSAFLRLSRPIPPPFILPMARATGAATCRWKHCFPTSPAPTSGPASWTNRPLYALAITKTRSLSGR